MGNGNVAPPILYPIFPPSAIDSACNSNKHSASQSDLSTMHGEVHPQKPRYDAIFSNPTDATLNSSKIGKRPRANTTSKKRQPPTKPKLKPGPPTAKTANAQGLPAIRSPATNAPRISTMAFSTQQLDTASKAPFGTKANRMPAAPTNTVTYSHL
jgi:hypothetical protein